MTREDRSARIGFQLALCLLVGYSAVLPAFAGDVSVKLDAGAGVVKYHVLPALLLNEVQKQVRANVEQQHTIEEQQRVNVELRTELGTLTTRLAQLETRDASRPAVAQR